MENSILTPEEMVAIREALGVQDRKDAIRAALEAKLGAPNQACPHGGHVLPNFGTPADGVIDAIYNKLSLDGSAGIAHVKFTDPTCGQAFYAVVTLSESGEIEVSFTAQKQMTRTEADAPSQIATLPLPPPEKESPADALRARIEQNIALRGLVLITGQTFQYMHDGQAIEMHAIPGTEGIFEMQVVGKKLLFYTNDSPEKINRAIGSLLEIHKRGFGGANFPAFMTPIETMPSSPSGLGFKYSEVLLVIEIPVAKRGEIPITANKLVLHGMTVDNERELFANFEATVYASYNPKEVTDSIKDAAVQAKNCIDLFKQLQQNNELKARISWNQSAGRHIVYIFREETLNVTPSGSENFDLEVKHGPEGTAPMATFNINSATPAEIDAAIKRMRTPTPLPVPRSSTPAPAAPKAPSPLPPFPRAGIEADPARRATIPTGAGREAPTKPPTPIPQTPVVPAPAPAAPQRRDTSSWWERPDDEVHAKHAEAIANEDRVEGERRKTRRRILISLACAGTVVLGLSEIIIGINVAKYKGWSCSRHQNTPAVSSPNARNQKFTPARTNSDVKNRTSTSPPSADSRSHESASARAKPGKRQVNCSLGVKTMPDSTIEWEAKCKGSPARIDESNETINGGHTVTGLRFIVPSIRAGVGECIVTLPAFDMKKGLPSAMYDCVEK